MASFGEGVHASFGRHATVFTFGQGWEGEAVSGEFVMDWAGSPDHVSSRIVARPRPIIN